MPSFSRVYGKVMNQIEAVADRGLLSEDERYELAYRLDSAMRLHEIGDRRGGWLLLKQVARATPGVKIKVR